MTKEEYLNKVIWDYNPLKEDQIANPKMYPQGYFKQNLVSIAKNYLLQNHLVNFIVLISVKHMG